jgi:hypothetical protein
MAPLLRRVSVGFTGGVLGALVNSWVVVSLGKLGVAQKFGVALAPQWSAAFLYPRLVWGGLWGLLFAWSFRSNRWPVSVFSRGILLSLFPTGFQLLYVFPVLAHKGIFGTSLGRLTPLFVFLLNVVWGWAAALWVHLEQGRHR